MDIISIAAQLILCLSILVVLHECGHFFPAKWFKTRVEKFYLFFNPGFSLFKKQIGETEYGIGWIPFGGYVKISGMIDESMDTEQMEAEPQPWEFRSKPAWQRLIIMVGGVTVNFILGFLIYSLIMWHWGESYILSKDVTYGVQATDLGEPKNLVIERDGQRMQLPVPDRMAEKLTKYENKGKGLFKFRFPQEVTAVDKGKPAEKAGVQVGDQIIQLDGQDTYYAQDFIKILKTKADATVKMTILRNQRDTVNTTITLGEDAKMGIGNKIKGWFPEQKQKYSLGEAFPKGYSKSVSFLTGQLKAFKQMFTGKIKATDSLGSVFSIANMFDPAWDWEKFWRITAMLSILLGFFNLLPIPALDGGYVML